MKKLSALILAAALSAAAQADTVSYQFSLGNAFTDFTERPGSLSYFNSSLGTLTGVTLTLFGNNSTDITLTNNLGSGAGSVLGAQTQTQLWFGSSLVPLNNAVLDYTMNLTPGFTIRAPGATVNPGQTYVKTGLTDSDSYAVDTSAFWQSFAKAGGGDFEVNCSTYTVLSTTVSGGNFSGSQNTTAGCGATVTYTYTASVTPPPPAVPEPASLALVGLGLVGVATSRRKSRKA